MPSAALAVAEDPEPASPSTSEPPDSVATPSAEAPGEPEPGPDENWWRKSPVLRSLVWLAHHQNEDGSWGDGPVTLEGHTVGKASVTALALLAFVGQGYSHYSKDEYDGLILGKTIRRAVDWLLRDQRDDGRFASVCDGGFDQAITTFALSDLYSTTAATLVKEPLEKALLSLELMQRPDGSWGSAAATAWALKALASAQYNEVPISEEVLYRGLQSAVNTSHPGFIQNWILVTKDRRLMKGAAEELFDAPPPTEDLAGWYHASGSLRLYDGTGGPLWQVWKEGLKTVVLGQQGSDGTWAGGTLSNTVVRSSFALQALEVLWRYSSGLGAVR